MSFPFALPLSHSRTRDDTELQRMEIQITIASATAITIIIMFRKNFSTVDVCLRGREWIVSSSRIEMALDCLLAHRNSILVNSYLSMPLASIFLFFVRLRPHHIPLDDFDVNVRMQLRTTTELLLKECVICARASEIYKERKQNIHTWIQWKLRREEVVDDDLMQLIHEFSLFQNKILS